MKSLSLMVVYTNLHRFYGKRASTKFHIEHALSSLGEGWGVGYFLTYGREVLLGFGVFVGVGVLLGVNEGVGVMVGVAVGGLPKTRKCPLMIHSVPIKNCNWYGPGSHSSADNSSLLTPYPPLCPCHVPTLNWMISPSRTQTSVHWIPLVIIL